MVSDPWEFGTECGVGPFLGSVSDHDDVRLLVVLDEPIVYRGVAYSSILGRPRLSDRLRVDHLSSSEGLFMNLALMPGRTSRLEEDIVAPAIGAIGSVRLR